MKAKKKWNVYNLVAEYEERPEGNEKLYFPTLSEAQSVLDECLGFLRPVAIYTLSFNLGILGLDRLICNDRFEHLYLALHHFSKYVQSNSDQVYPETVRVKLERDLYMSFGFDHFKSARFNEYPVAYYVYLGLCAKNPVDLKKGVVYIEW